MMVRRSNSEPSYVVDDEIAKVVGRYKLELIATLIAVCRDDRAPAAARRRLPPNCWSIPSKPPSLTCRMRKDSGFFTHF
jgi:hypothetical protein